MRSFFISEQFDKLKKKKKLKKNKFFYPQSVGQNVFFDKK